MKPLTNNCARKTIMSGAQFTEVFTGHFTNINRLWKNVRDIFNAASSEFYTVIVQCSVLKFPISNHRIKLGLLEFNKSLRRLFVVITRTVAPTTRSNFNLKHHHRKFNCFVRCFPHCLSQYHWKFPKTISLLSTSESHF